MRKPGSKWKIMIPALVIALLLIYLGVFVFRTPETATPEAPAAQEAVQEATQQGVQETAPPASTPQEDRINMMDFLSTTKLDLEPYKGKALFLNFFTEWCPYCMQEMPDIKKVFETYSQDDLQIILVHVWQGEDEKNTESIRKTYGLEDMTFFEDEDMALATRLSLPGFPTSFFIDQEGYLVKAIPSALSFEAMAEYIDGMGVTKGELQ